MKCLFNDTVNNNRAHSSRQQGTCTRYLVFSVHKIKTEQCSNRLLSLSHYGPDIKTPMQSKCLYFLPFIVAKESVSTSATLKLTAVSTLGACSCIPY